MAQPSHPSRVELEQVLITHPLCGRPSHVPDHLVRAEAPSGPEVDIVSYPRGLWGSAVPGGAWRTPASPRRGSGSGGHAASVARLQKRWATRAAGETGGGLCEPGT
jgi:hypothetical protein